MATCTVTMNFRDGIDDSIPANVEVTPIAVQLGNPIVAPATRAFNVSNGGTFTLYQGDRLGIAVTNWGPAALYYVEVPELANIDFDELVISFSIDKLSGTPAMVLPRSVLELARDAVAAAETAETSATTASSAADSASASAAAAEAVGTTNDEIMTAIVENSDSGTAAALSASFVKRGMLSLDPRDVAEGIDLTGTSDSSSALQLWLDTMKAEGLPGLLPEGRFRLATPLVFSGSTTSASGPMIDGKGMWRSTLVPDFTGAAAFTVDRSGGQFFFGGHLRGFGIESASSSVDGISVTGWWSFEFDDLRVDGLAGNAIVFPLRTDLSSNPDDYASPMGVIRRHYLVSNKGWGILGAAGLGWSSCEVSHGKINSNEMGGVYLAGHSLSVHHNAIAGNGAAGGSAGVVVGYVQATPNAIQLGPNEYDGNYEANIIVVAADGGRIEGRSISSEKSGAQRPPLHVRLGDSAHVHTVQKLDINLYHRSAGSNNYPVSLYKFDHTSVIAHRITPTIPSADNSTAATRYDGLTANHVTEVLELGSVAAAAPATRYFLGRIRTAANVTGTATQVVFDNEWQDPKNDNDTSLGYLTKYLGVYDVSGFVTLSGLSAGNTVTVQVLVGGSTFKEIKLPASGLADETFRFASKVYATAGSRIIIRASQNSGADKAIKVGDMYNELSILAVR